MATDRVKLFVLVISVALGCGWIGYNYGHLEAAHRSLGLRAYARNAKEMVNRCEKDAEAARLNLDLVSALRMYENEQRLNDAHEGLDTAKARLRSIHTEIETYAKTDDGGDRVRIDRNNEAEPVVTFYDSNTSETIPKDALR